MDGKDWVTYICAGAALLATIMAAFPQQTRVRVAFGIAAIVLFLVAGIVGLTNSSKKPELAKSPVVSAPAATSPAAPAPAETTSDPVAPPVSSPTGPVPSFQLQMGANTYADLDTGETSTSGGRSYEVRLDILARLFHRNDTNDATNTFLSQYRVVDLDDTDAAACSHTGRLLNKGFIAANDLQDNNLCVSTSEKHWAILALDDIDGTNPFSVDGAAFNVFLSK